MKNLELFKSIYWDVKAYIDTIDSTEQTYRTFKVVWADQSINRNDRALIIDWIDTTNYEKNPVVFINHESYDVQKIVWKTTKLTKEKDKIIFEGVFAPNELWQDIADLYDSGFLRTVSLGYDVLSRDEKDPRICLTSELYEISFVAIPANVNAERMDSVQLEKFNKLKDAWLIIEQEPEEVIQDNTDKFTLLESKIDMILEILSKNVDNKEVKTEEKEENEEDEYDTDLDMLKIYIDKM